jgi:hypothetical protein
MLSVISNGIHVLIQTRFTHVVDYQIVTVGTDGMLCVNCPVQHFVLINHKLLKAKNWEITHKI